MQFKHAVIKWSPENRYYVEDILRAYKIEGAAKRLADKLNAKGGSYVVRDVRYMRERCLESNHSIGSEKVSI